MYIYQNGKLYVQMEKQLVGVNISPDKVSLVKETAVLSDNFQIFTWEEANAKLGISEEKPYVFPITKEAVKKDDSIRKPRNTPVPKRRTGRPKKSS